MLLLLSIVLFSSCQKSGSNSSTNNTNTQNYFKVGTDEYVIANAYYDVDSINNFSFLVFSTPNLNWNTAIGDLQGSGNFIEFDIEDISDTLKQGNLLNPAQFWAAVTFNYVYPIYPTGGIDQDIDDNFPGYLNITRTNSNYEIHFQFKLTTGRIVQGVYIGRVQRIYQ